MKKCRNCRVDSEETYCSKSCEKKDVIPHMERYKDDYGNLTESGKKFLNSKFKGVINLGYY